jgi:NAD(P)-dependent dehydrogenase (short-subunit alcohol dehydrogenase family)
VTGGGTGIGRAIALAMARRGGTVFISGRRREPLGDTAALIKEAGGVCHCVEADVTKEQDVRRLMVKVRETFGGLDVLVNNAGLFRTGRVHDMSTDDFDLMFSVNVRGVFLVAKEAVHLMQERPGANIINISSIAGTRTDPGMGVYEASKAAVNTLTKVMAKELAPFSIRVNAIAPGPTATPALDAGDPGEAEQARQQLASAVPFGRLGQPDEVARLAVFIASPEADFISGSITSIDGAMGY